MIRSLMVLLIGFLLGYFTRGLFVMDREEVVAKISPIAVARNLEASVKRVESSETSAEADSKTASAALLGGSERETESTIRFRLEESTIQVMENAHSELRNQAVSEATAEGWKIHLLPDDKIFLATGLRSGDVITQESLSVQLASPEREALARRFVAILKSIER